MYIGKAAQLSGTTIKAIRHYEAIGLLPLPQREGQYRVYSEQSVELLMFIKCAQQLGLKKLARPWLTPPRATAHELAEADSNLVQSLRGHFGFGENLLNSRDPDYQGVWLERLGRGETVSPASGNWAKATRYCLS